MSDKSNSFCGKLSPAEIAKGMNLAEQNALRLIDDATILFNSKRYPTACSLAILAYEELGKVVFLRHIATASTPEILKINWKGYRKHTSKSRMLSVQRLSISPKAVAEKNLSSVQYLAITFSKHLDTSKELGFYVDCLGSSSWSIPWKNISGEFAKTVLDFVRDLTRNIKHTEREIELYIEHIGPCMNLNLSSKKQAVKNYVEALKNEGISIRELSRFTNLPR